VITNHENIFYSTIHFIYFAVLLYSICNIEISLPMHTAYVKMFIANIYACSAVTAKYNHIQAKDMLCMWTACDSSRGY